MVIGFIIRYLGILMIAAAVLLLGAVFLYVFFINERIKSSKKHDAKNVDSDE